MPLTPGLDPDLLRTFTLIAEEASFTRAAQRVGRTQSAVSMQIQRLEGLLGERLITRSKGGAVHLTPHGQQVHVRRLRHGRTSQHGHPGPKHPSARDAVPLGEVCDLPRLLIVKPYSEAVPARLTARTPAVASLIS